MKFCSQCGNAVSLKTPEDDDRQRFVCDHCTTIHYQNPRIIVCSLPCHEDQVLLCKRAIEPRYGLWTLPGGFLENGETTLEGALRETLEEAGARIRISGLYTVYNLPHIDQVHMFFLSSLLDCDFFAGRESLEVRLFHREEIPWDEIAFPAVSNTLEHYFNDRQHNSFPVRMSDVIVTPGHDRIIKAL
ncbi:MAG: NUDIX hydrolase [Pseudomonadales bacterium]|nr:NUDIX hydrolase [Pseudomonadales bacterium]